MPCISMICFTDKETEAQKGQGWARVQSQAVWFWAYLLNYLAQLPLMQRPLTRIRGFTNIAWSLAAN